MIDIKRVWAIFFSPNGKTKHVTLKIAEELSNNLNVDLNIYDFTLKDKRDNFPKLDENDLVVFGVPTYAGRVPNVLLPYFEKVKSNRTIAIPIVTFGNRNYDNSLYELNMLLKKGNFNILSLAAIATKHSFSNILARDLPDSLTDDELTTFANNSLEKLNKGIINDIALNGDLSKYYKPLDEAGNELNFLKIKPVTDSSCTNCKKCVEVCPMGVIDKNDPKIISSPCIKCHACVNICPASSKYFDDLDFLTHKRIIETENEERKNNTFFI